MRKIMLTAIKLENLFIHVNTVTNNLKDVLTDYANNNIYNTFKLNTT